jgi:hypothetical protein
MDPPQGKAQRFSETPSAAANNFSLSRFYFFAAALAELFIADHSDLVVAGLT